MRHHPRHLVHGIIPMAGEGRRFVDVGYRLPKPLIDLHGRPFFFWSAEFLSRCVPLASLTFVVLRHHVDIHRIDAVIHRYFPQARIVVIQEKLNGPVLSCLACIEEIPNDHPLLFNDSDHLFESASLSRWIESGQAEASGIGGSLISFESQNRSYSYLIEDEGGKVIATVEKRPVSRHAICGSYLFRNRDTFKSAANHYLGHCAYPEFYMSGVYNSLIGQGLRVNHLPLDLHLSFGTPEELRAVENHGLFSRFCDK